MVAKADFKIINFDRVEATMTIAMTVAEWRDVLKRLNPGDSNGQWYFHRGIIKMIDQFSQSFSIYETDTIPLSRDE